MALERRLEIKARLDVGTSSLRACATTCGSETPASMPITNRKNAFDSLFAEFPGALVVDRIRNIGALTHPRAGEGNTIGVSAGLGRPQGASLFSDDAKTDDRDEIPTPAHYSRNRAENDVRTGGFPINIDDSQITTGWRRTANRRTATANRTRPCRLYRHPDRKANGRRAFSCPNVIA